MKYKVILIPTIHNKSNEILLIRRAREPFIGKWSLNGGLGALEKE